MMFGGMRIIEKPTLPPGVVEFRDPESGRLLAVIVGLDPAELLDLGRDPEDDDEEQETEDEETFHPGRGGDYGEV